MIPDNAPAWLKAARTQDAEVEITSGGRVVWHGGLWRGGFTSATRAPFRVTSRGDCLRVGCWSGTIEEARALICGGGLPYGAPDRDSEAGRLLRAAVIAQIAYQEALK
jgi:hypothetical protein